MPLEEAGVTLTRDQDHEPHGEDRRNKKEHMRTSHTRSLDAKLVTTGGYRSGTRDEGTRNSKRKNDRLG